jgi:hypothetical protein
LRDVKVRGRGKGIGDYGGFVVRFCIRVHLRDVRVRVRVRVKVKVRVRLRDYGGVEEREREGRWLREWAETHWGRVRPWWLCRWWRGMKMVIKVVIFTRGNKGRFEMVRVLLLLLLLLLVVVVVVIILRRYD